MSDKGFRLATYAMWWIRAHIQDYILRTWSLVRISASSAQKKLFFKLRQTKARISALEDGDLRPDHARLLASRLKASEHDVVEMNERLRGDVSLNVPVNTLAETGEWQDWLVDPTENPEDLSAENDEAYKRRCALTEALKLSAIASGTSFNIGIWQMNPKILSSSPANTASRANTQAN